jgi:hypothetical protein
MAESDILENLKEVLSDLKKASPWRDAVGIAARYDVSERTIDEWTANRVIPSVKKGRVLRYHIHDCDRALKAYERKSIAFPA